MTLSIHSIRQTLLAGLVTLPLAAQAPTPNIRVMILGTFRFHTPNAD